MSTPFVHVLGRSRAYDRIKQSARELAPSWLVRVVQLVSRPYGTLRWRLREWRRLQGRLSLTDRRQFVRLRRDAERRWNAGRIDPTGPAVALPVPGSDRRVFVRPGTSDVLVYRDIFVLEQYGQLPVDRVETIVDCGANIGLTSAYLLSAHSAARSIAIESDGDNIALCRRNLDSFGQRATVVHAALWDRPGQFAVRPERAGTWASAVRPATAADQQRVVPGVTLPGLISQFELRQIDILKIDVEGAEVQIFSAADLSWLDRVGCLMIDLEDARSREAFYRALAGRPFELSQYRDVTVARRTDRVGSGSQT